jgi:antitoxin (DNA-binding transcriptional repressor) of toxin-antitoxin stability system
MTRKLTQRELRRRNGRILRALDGGEEFVLTRKGKAVGEPRPIRRRQFVPTGRVIAAFKNVPAIDYGERRADLDAVADPDPTPRYWLE